MMRSLLTSRVCATAIFLSTIAVGSSVGLAASTSWLATVRGNADAASAFCRRVKGCKLLPTSALEFENGNTFVRLGADVIQRSVTVLLPATLTADQLMEALIIVHTAKTAAAAKIIVAAPVALAQVQVSAGGNETIAIDLKRLFADAGADYARTNGPVISRVERLKVKPHRAVSVGSIFQSVVFDGGQHPALAADLAAKMNLKLVTSLSAEGARHTQVFLVAPPVAPVNENFFKTLANISRIADAGGSAILVTPYLPYARSDKIDQPRVTITGRLVADLIEGAGADAISFVRAHAPQSQGFFRIPTFHVSGRQTINGYLRGRGVEVIVSPDAGFQKDATLYADELGLPIAVANKQRDPITGVATLKGIGGASVKGKIVAIIDDETASGSTLHTVADLLKNQLGAREVIGVVTHLSGSGKKALESSALSSLVVTNTLPVNSQGPRLTVLSVGPEMASALGALTPSRLRKLTCEQRLVQDRTE